MWYWLGYFLGSKHDVHWGGGHTSHITYRKPKSNFTQPFLFVLWCEICHLSFKAFPAFDLGVRDAQSEF